MVEDFVKKIAWLGHDCFRIDTDKVIYFDPFQITAAPKADIILVTHDHFDHCSPEDVAKVAQSDTVIVTEKDSAKKLTGDLRILAPGETLTEGDITIKAVPAYNTNKKFHPKENGWLGFVVTVAGVSIYHAGDTDYIPEMKGLAPDIALLPVSGTYVMTADEAVAAAVAIEPKLAIPMHYGAGVVGDIRDAQKFESGLEGKIPVTILSPSA